MFSILELQFVCISDVSAACFAAGVAAGLAAALLHPGQPDGLPSQQTSAVSVRFAFRHQTSLAFFVHFGFASGEFHASTLTAAAALL
jgi:hypothetical protein